MSSKTRAEVELLTRRARELAAKAPAKAAMILTSWMKTQQLPGVKQTANYRKKVG